MAPKRSDGAVVLRGEDYRGLGGCSGHGEPTEIRGSKRLRGEAAPEQERVGKRLKGSQMDLRRRGGLRQWESPQDFDSEKSGEESGDPSLEPSGKSQYGDGEDDEGVVYAGEIFGEDGLDQRDSEEGEEDDHDDDASEGTQLHDEQVEELEEAEVGPLTATPRRSPRNSSGGQGVEREDEAAPRDCSSLQCFVNYTKTKVTALCNHKPSTMIPSTSHLDACSHDYNLTTWYQATFLI